MCVLLKEKLTWKKNPIKLPKKISSRIAASLKSVAVIPSSSKSQNSKVNCSVLRQPRFPGDEIPTIHVTKPGNLQRGQNYTLTCNVTSRGRRRATLLRRISWFKNGILLETVRLPDPDSPKDFLKPIMITDASAKDVGVYICLLEVLARRVVNVNVTDNATITGECSRFTHLLY